MCVYLFIPISPPVHLYIGTKTHHTEYMYYTYIHNHLCKTCTHTYIGTHTHTHTGFIKSESRVAKEIANVYMGNESFGVEKLSCPAIGEKGEYANRVSLAYGTDSGNPLEQIRKGNISRMDFRLGKAKLNCRRIGGEEWVSMEWLAIVPLILHSAL